MFSGCCMRHRRNELSYEKEQSIKVWPCKESRRGIAWHRFASRRLEGCWQKRFSTPRGRHTDVAITWAGYRFAAPRRLVGGTTPITGASPRVGTIPDLTFQIPTLTDEINRLLSRNSYASHFLCFRKPSLLRPCRNSLLIWGSIRKEQYKHCLFLAPYLVEFKTSGLPILTRNNSKYLDWNSG